MYSELFRIPIKWNGVPVFGFGVVLLAWLGVGAWALVSTARAAGWPASLKAHLATVLIVAAIVAAFIPRMFPEGVPLRGYGLMVLLGSVVGIAMSLRRALQAGLEADDILALAVAMFVGGVIGARLFYVVEYWDARIRQADVWSTIKAALAFTEGGLVIYGAFIGSMAAFVLFVRRHKLPALALADLIAPSMAAGLAIGRIGCLMNGCCYGGESTAPWSITFPRENAAQSLSAPYADQAGRGRFYGLRLAPAAGALVVLNVEPGSPADKAGLAAGDKIASINGQSLREGANAAQMILEALSNRQPLKLVTSRGEATIPAIEPPLRSLPVHPAQVYSAIEAGLLAWMLWSYYPFRRRDGEVLALLMAIHPISRFLLEIIRVDESPVFGTGLSISQLLSALFFAIGVGLWLYLRRKPLGKLAFPVAGAPAA